MGVSDPHLCLPTFLLLLLSPSKNTDVLFVLTYWLLFAMYCCAHSCICMGVLYAHECYVQFNMEVRGSYQLFCTIFILNSLGMNLSLNLELTTFWLTDWPTNASRLSVYASTVFDSRSMWSHLALPVGMGVGIIFRSSC